MTSPARIRASIALQAPERRRYRDPEELASFMVCPHCMGKLTVHGFIAKDGAIVETYHCKQHGDVCPRRSAITNNVELLGAEG